MKSVVTVMVLSYVLVSGISPQRVMADDSQSSRQQHLDTINAHFGSGVRPSENAVVLIYEAFGPHPERANLPPEFFELLQIAPPPEAGDYFDPYPAGPEESESFNTQLDRAMEAPWQRSDCPLIAKWIDSEKAPVETVIRAIQRPKWYAPLAPGRDEHGQQQNLVMTLLPATQQYRAVARYLICRSMLHAGEKNYDAAWNDLRECMRLGRMVSRGPTLIDYLVGLAIDSIATSGLTNLVKASRPDAGTLTRYRREVQELPGMAEPVRLYDLTERLMMIDIIDGLESGEARELFPTIFGHELTGLERLALVPVQWDIVRRECHAMFDTVTRSTQIEDADQRAAAMRQFDAMLKERRELSPASLLRHLQRQPTILAAWSSVMADRLNGMMLPAVGVIDGARARGIARARMTQLMLAAEQYRVRNGDYPERLEQLLQREPELEVGDPFSDGLLRLRRTNDSLLIYSVGLNRRDDDGQSYDDQGEGDDVVVKLATG